MPNRPVVLFVVGTRPDAIKSAPTILEFLKYPQVKTVVAATGQHREMLSQALDAFGLTADFDLDIMTEGQTLAQVTCRALAGLDEIIEQQNPDWVLAQGDTTTTFVAGLAAFYRQVPFGHIEAGLRTPTIWNPFPEEFNRRAVGMFAQHHYAPTAQAAANLRAEGAPAEQVFVTGNTGIDAVLQIARQTGTSWYEGETRRIILLTTHRRENWGEPQARIAQATRQLLDAFEDTILVVAMHRNPMVRKTLIEILGDHPRANLIEPPPYADFVKLMERSTLILSDSGGVQEEAPAFSRPVLVLRDTTERPEGLSAGVAKLVGTNTEFIFAEASRLLSSKDAYDQMATAASPYGDGRASERIRYLLFKDLNIDSEEVPMWES